ncbi:MAG: hypothetical protein H6Q01_1144, partial [Acidobacteria bacterium]|nr:hypothetical protein [Acidobacteriota bacterium]
MSPIADSSSFRVTPVATSVIHSRWFLSVCATRLPSGEGIATQRSTSPSVVTCRASPTPLAGRVQSSTSPDSSESETRDFPSGRKRASRKRTPGRREASTNRPGPVGATKTCPRAVSTTRLPSGDGCAEVVHVSGSVTVRPRVWSRSEPSVI